MDTEKEKELAQKYCTECKQIRDPKDSFCWLCGAELVPEPTNRCTKEEIHTVDSVDHFCTTCGAQTTFGVKRDGLKPMVAAEPSGNPADDCDIPF